MQESKIKYDLNFLEEDRCRVVVSYEGIKELGTLYFEPPKKKWSNKPIMNMKWACVDAKVEGLYEYGGEQLTPKDIVGICQDLISSHLGSE
jgi:hypothetical protein